MNDTKTIRFNPSLGTDVHRWIPQGLSYNIFEIVELKKMVSPTL